MVSLAGVDAVVPWLRYLMYMLLQSRCSPSAFQNLSTASNSCLVGLKFREHQSAVQLQVLHKGTSQVPATISPCRCRMLC